MLKRRFPDLNDDDFYYEGEDRESMLDKLQTKLKKTREELEALFADLQLY